MDIIRIFLENIVLNKIKEILPLASIQEHYISMTAGMKNCGNSRKILAIQMKGNNTYGFEDKHQLSLLPFSSSRNDILYH